VRFERLSFLRFGSGPGRDRGFGTNGCDRRRRLAGMIMLVMIVLANMTMVVMIMMVVVMMVILMGVMMVVMPMIAVIMVMMIMLVMIVALVLAVMLGIGVQMLALVRGAFGQDRALDRLGGGIGTFDDVAADALALTAAAGVAVARAAAAV